MRTTSGNISNCGVEGRGPPDRCVKYCFRALLPMPREEFGNCSLEVDVCTSVAQWSSQRVFFSKKNLTSQGCGLPLLLEKTKRQKKLWAMQEGKVPYNNFPQNFKNVDCNC